jgi:hypothetical protein
MDIFSYQLAHTSQAHTYRRQDLVPIYGGGATADIAFERSMLEAITICHWAYLPSHSAHYPHYSSSCLHYIQLDTRHHDQYIRETKLVYMYSVARSRKALAMQKK